VRQHTERVDVFPMQHAAPHTAALSGAGAAGGLLVSRQHDNAMEHAMNTSIPKPEPGADGNNIYHEADIGSGERSPGQHETDEMIRSIPPRTGNQQDAGNGGSQQGGNAGQPAKG
jgi:hypothetical protein